MDKIVVIFIALVFCVWVVLTMKRSGDAEPAREKVLQALQDAIGNNLVKYQQNPLALTELYNQAVKDLAQLDDLVCKDPDMAVAEVIFKMLPDVDWEAFFRDESCFEDSNDKNYTEDFRYALLEFYRERQFLPNA